jgi:hypothetical protein
MEVARSLRQNKFRIKLCEYSYELLLQYLHKTQALVVLGIINERIDFQVSPGQSPLIIDDSDAVVLIGTSKDLTKQINQKEVHWGILEDSLEERMEKAISDSDKTEIESKDADTEDNKARNCFVVCQSFFSFCFLCPRSLKHKLSFFLVRAILLATCDFYGCFIIKTVLSDVHWLSAVYDINVSLICSTM